MPIHFEGENDVSAAPYSLPDDNVQIMYYNVSGHVFTVNSMNGS